MTTRQRLCILGSTGSIGTNTLDVAARHPERFEVVALSAHSRVDELLAQCRQWRPRWAAMSDVDAAQRVAGGLGFLRHDAHGVRRIVAADVEKVRDAVRLVVVVVGRLAGRAGVGVVASPSLDRIAAASGRTIDVLRV